MNCHFLKEMKVRSTNELHKCDNIEAKHTKEWKASQKHSLGRRQELSNVDK